MSTLLYINNTVSIPEHELEITASRSGGPGGQHVNKTDSRITIRWNVKTTSALTEQQKELIILRLKDRLTTDGDLIIHCNTTRSQQQNRKLALMRLAQEIKKALFVAKKRLPTKASRSSQEKRLVIKSHHSLLKKLRSKKNQED